MKWSDLRKDEVDYLIDYLNMTEDEETVFLMLVKGKSIKQIADNLMVSTRTVDRRISDIKKKVGM